MERKYKIILFALLLGTFMTALDATIVAVAIPEIAKTMGEEGHNTQNISWILLAYTLMLSCFILLWSKIGSTRGFKKVFVTGISIFGVSSLAIGLFGLNPSIGLTAIILMRGVQGIGAGMSMAVSLAMVSTFLPKEIRGSAIGAITLAASCGTAFGPAIGGVLTAFHWSYIFFINVPIAIICIFLSLKYMTVQENLPEKQKLDVLGAIFLFVMMFSFIFYLNKGSDIGWMSETGILLIAACAVFFGLVVWWEGRTAFPIISARLVKDRNILKSLIVGTLLFMAMGGSYLLMPYYMQYIKDMSTIQLGLILVANSVGMLLAGPIVGRMADKTGKTRVFMIAGSAVAALGFYMMMTFAADTQIWYVIVALFVMGVGIGMAIVSSTNFCFTYILNGEDGELSGLTNTFRQAGSSAGVSIMNAVFMANIAMGGATVAAKLMPAFKHAFFIAVIIALMAMGVAIMCEEKAKEA